MNLSQVPNTGAIKICFSGVTDGCLKGVFGSGIYGFWGVSSHKPKEVVKANAGQNMYLIKINFIIRNKDIFSFLSIHSWSGANFSSNSKSCILQLLNSTFCLKYKKDFLNLFLNASLAWGEKIRNSKHKIKWHNSTLMNNWLLSYFIIKTTLKYFSAAHDVATKVMCV